MEIKKKMSNYSQKRFLILLLISFGATELRLSSFKKDVKVVDEQVGRTQ